MATFSRTILLTTFLGSVCLSPLLVKGAPARREEIHARSFSNTPHPDEHGATQTTPSLIKRQQSFRKKDTRQQQKRLILDQSSNQNQQDDFDSQFSSDPFQAPSNQPNGPNQGSQNDFDDNSQNQNSLERIGNSPLGSDSRINNDVDQDGRNQRNEERGNIGNQNDAFSGGISRVNDNFNFNLADQSNRGDDQSNNNQAGQDDSSLGGVSRLVQNLASFGSVQSNTDNVEGIDDRSTSGSGRLNRDNNNPIQTGNDQVNRNFGGDAGNSGRQGQENEFFGSVSRVTNGFDQNGGNRFNRDAGQDKGFQVLQNDGSSGSISRANNNGNSQLNRGSGQVNNNGQTQNVNSNVGQNQQADLIDFSAPVEITGGNTRTVVRYMDGLNIDTISKDRHTLNVQLNQQPPTVDFVTPLDPSRVSVGGPWVALTDYSYVFSFENTNPDDLIMRIQAPYSQRQLDNRGVSDNDVFLALFDTMRGGWVIDTDQSTNRRDAKITEINGVSAPRGEYIVLARQPPRSIDEANPYLRFGTSQFNVLGPPSNTNMPPMQIGSWQDGSKVFIRSAVPMQIQMTIANVSERAIPPGFQSASLYACVFSSNSDRATVVTHLQMPYVPTQLAQRNIDPATLWVMGRQLGSTGSYQMLSSTSLTGPNALMNIPMTMVSGEYLLAAPIATTARSVQSQPNQPQPPGVPVPSFQQGQVTGQVGSFATAPPTSPADATRNILPATQPLPPPRPAPNALPPIQSIGGSSTRLSENQNAQIRTQTNLALAQNAFDLNNNNGLGISRSLDPSNNGFNNGGLSTTLSRTNSNGFSSSPSDGQVTVFPSSLSLNRNGANNDGRFGWRM